MKVTLITQTEEIINYDNLLKITTAEAELDGKPLYVIIAYPLGVKVTEEDTDHLIQLGVYDEETKAVKVYEELVKFLKNGVASVFAFPVDIAEG